MNWTRAALVVVLVAPLFVILAFGFGVNPHAVPFMLKDRPAPQFQLVTLDGEPFDSTRMQGKPTVVNFWATWCVPCEQEHKLLQGASRYYKDTANFVGVVYQDEEEAAENYLRKNGSNFTQCMDQDSRAAIDFGVAGVPESFIIDADGIVRYKHEGVLTRAVFERELEPLIDRAFADGSRANDG